MTQKRRPEEYLLDVQPTAPFQISPLEQRFIGLLSKISAGGVMVWFSFKELSDEIQRFRVKRGGRKL